MPPKQSAKQTTKQSALVKRPQSSLEHKSSFMNTVKEGVGFGIGSAIGHSIVQRIFSNPTPTAQQVSPQSEPIQQDTTVSRSIGALSTQDISGQLEYIQCRKEGGTEESCKQYIV